MKLRNIQEKRKGNKEKFFAKMGKFFSINAEKEL